MKHLPEIRIVTKKGWQKGYQDSVHEIDENYYVCDCGWEIKDRDYSNDNQCALEVISHTLYHMRDYINILLSDVE